MCVCPYVHAYVYICIRPCTYIFYNIGYKLEVAKYVYAYCIHINAIMQNIHCACLMLLGNVLSYYYLLKHSGSHMKVIFQIEALVLKYISKKEALILVVVAGNSEIATTKALRLAKTADPEGRRTIGKYT